jgi:hypothetical protein
MIMIHNTISQYVHTMFDESRDGELTVGNDDDQFDCPVAWDEQTAEGLAEQCSTLIAHLTELAEQYDKLLHETRHLTKAQMDVWNTYLRPFPKHGLDMEVLQAIWEKFETGEPVTEEEWALADQYIHWFEENALTRLPQKCYSPAQLISRAKRYGKLVRLHAPTVVLESEAKRFAEEFVMYHCMKK